jgi:hypothetical protein
VREAAEMADLVPRLPHRALLQAYRVDYHGAKEVPTGTCHAILKAAGLEGKDD